MLAGIIPVQLGVIRVCLALTLGRRPLVGPFGPCLLAVACIHSREGSLSVLRPEVRVKPAPPSAASTTPSTAPAAPSASASPAPSPATSRASLEGSSRLLSTLTPSAGVRALRHFVSSFPAFPFHTPSRSDVGGAFFAILLHVPWSIAIIAFVTLPVVLLPFPLDIIKNAGFLLSRRSRVVLHPPP